MFFGLVLIAVGILWLLEKLDVIPGSIWQYIWPVILILLGVSMLWGRHRMRVWRRRLWPSDEEPKQ